MELKSNLKDLIQEFTDTFSKKVALAKAIGDINQLKSELSASDAPLQKWGGMIKEMSLEEKKQWGPLINQAKTLVNSVLAAKGQEIEQEAINQKLLLEKIDTSWRPSLQADYAHHGGLHPVTQVQQEIEDIFLRMGFEVLDGPHMETELTNFESLNIPSDHPARDMQDTFWFEHPHEPCDRKEGRRLLRTHTSTIQVRGMLERKAPFRFIAPGKVFRCERTDAGHEMVFHQIEGMMVGKDISVANLIYFMKTLLGEIFQRDVEVRLRPGFFPFVEPGFELDIQCLLCAGKGCSVCKQVGWLELLPCGLVHPKVLEAGGIDSKEWSGFAFGLGLDRLVMMRYGIDDIRHLHSGDLRFVQQFAQY
jgi:phenylalanyl-tRNA synthetase alpha chain